MPSTNIIVHGDFCLTLFLRLSISITNKQGLRADPWCAPTSTLISPYRQNKYKTPEMTNALLLCFGVVGPAPLSCENGSVRTLAPQMDTDWKFMLQNTMSVYVYCSTIKTSVVQCKAAVFQRRGWGLNP